jgi:hypothetical protein
VLATLARGQHGDRQADDDMYQPARRRARAASHGALSVGQLGDRQHDQPGDGPRSEPE